MKQSRAPLDIVFFVDQTAHAADRLNDIWQRAHRSAHDTEKERRLEFSKCKACFYLDGRFGGASITDRDCMCCGKEMSFPSTYTDVLCLDCAKEHSLCKHCGADMQLRVGRRNWPVKD